MNTGNNIHLLAKFCQQQEYPTNTLRWQIHNAEQNGLAKSGAIIRVKNRPDAKRGTIYIDADAYFKWLRGQSEAAA